MPNHLLHAQSLYLRKHAHNPIDWYSWGEEALSRAKQEQKPIFLSIGYSSCHWCTVMEGEAFSDSAIAHYLNNNFIAIKVDREERPDIDSIYMQALQMMTGQGGWPLNIFLTPDDLVPFYGGTYFPLEPRYGRPGFLQILESIHNFYHQQTEKLNALKQEIVGILENNSNLKPNPDNHLNPKLLSQGLEKNSKILARNEYGSPRFPMMPYSNTTLVGIHTLSPENANKAHQLCIQRGIDLVNGGIYDHVGGGFHRYTVDSTWTVPHFEKMLYDNGLIMEFLANLWSSGTEKTQYRVACEGTLAWLEREMSAPEGYFYSAQDADNFPNIQDEEPEEGDFYVWHYLDLQQILSHEELIAFQEVFTISNEGNFEGKNVLQKHPDKPITPIVKTALDKLFTMRYGQKPDKLTTFAPARNNDEAKSLEWLGRIPPVTDTKMIVAWNSLMISGLARAYGVFGDSKYLDLAETAVKFILKNQWENQRLHRLNYGNKVSTLAQSEDYAFLIKALLDLQQNSLNAGNYWLEKAIKVQEEFDHYCYDQEDGGYYNNAHDNSNDLLIKEKGYIDNATPSPNGVAVANLVRLGLMTDNLEYFDKAEKTLEIFSEKMTDSSVSCPSLFTGLKWFLDGSSVKSSVQLLEDLNKLYLPNFIPCISKDIPDNSVGLVCRGLSCLEPAVTKEQIIEQVSITGGI
ncbi:thioredoxin domain-containing protein [Cyanobacterium sp. IPPAS B-1200]|uniref:thioredoxin domain-containing protein n=1 Tax=Cyanobacterium sp. IPPAS B-1200 TaxID=1562720 RepID=UPI0008526899|nr:thioredoxin domain-containing protein [Cyanobacterium sp. IPPAS B-1200]OEJ78170.1 glycosidase [Cyanobacterium sp. IPPAS B-1200]